MNSSNRFRKNRLIDAEIKKIKVETESIASELEIRRKNAAERKGILERYSGTGSFILALVAIGTLGLNLFNNFEERDLRSKKEVSDAVSSLSSDDAIIRASAVSVIHPHLQDSALGDTYTGALVLAYGSERNAQVRNLIIESLKLRKNLAIRLLKDLRASSNANSILLLGNWSAEVHRLNNQKASDESDDVVNKTRDEVAKKLEALRTSQWTSIYAADAIRKVECDPSIPCNIDLSGLVLRSISFTERNIDLNGADFSGAFLGFADFFDVELNSANFDEAYIAHADFFGAEVSNASFRNARAVLRVELPSEREIRRCKFTNGARFSGDVSTVDFQGANLSGANFESASITEGQLQSSTWEGATLSIELAASLSYKNPIPLPDIQEPIERECSR